MASNNDPVPLSTSPIRSPISMIHPQGPPLGRRSLPPANVFGPQHVLPTYPSSTLHCYYPSSHPATNYAHISAPMPSSHSHPPLSGDFPQFPLPSASQLHIPSLRHTPSVFPLQNTRTQNFPPSPAFDQRNNDSPRNFQRIHTVSPIAFAQPQPLPFFCCTTTIPFTTATSPFTSSP